MPSRPMGPRSGALSRVAAAFEAVQVPFLIGGSLASSTRGVWRAAMDVDSIAWIRDDQVAGSPAELGPD